MTGQPITEPGLYPGIPADDYHRDPVAGGSLSSSGARALLPPSCPARYRHDQDHGQTPKRHYDIGHLAHKLVLGEGNSIAIIDAGDWRTKAAKTERDEAREAGQIPVLIEEYRQVAAMANAINEHPIAAALFNHDNGAPEQTLVWRDQTTGVMCRARYDWLPNPNGGRLVLADYKTCASAEPEQLRKAMATHGYHVQAAWYLTAAREVLAAQDPGFVFVCQEKTPPYLVTIFEPDSIALRIGLAMSNRARAIYAHCVETGRWPAYSDDVELLALPRWAELQEGE